MISKSSWFLHSLIYHCFSWLSIFLLWAQVMGIFLFLFFFPRSSIIQILIPVYLELIISYGIGDRGQELFFSVQIFWLTQHYFLKETALLWLSLIFYLWHNGDHFRGMEVACFWNFTYISLVILSILCWYHVILTILALWVLIPDYFGFTWYFAFPCVWISFPL